MFNDKYKNAMDCVNSDNETKERILDNIILKEEVKRYKNPAIPWRIAFACVACIAIVLGVLFVPRDEFEIDKTGDRTAPQTLVVTKSYDDIYKLVKPKSSKKFIDAIKYKYNVTNDMEAVIEEEIEYADGSIMTGDADMSTNTNGSAKPDAATGGSSASDKEDFSATTEQVEGVAEADIVKTDGEYIYYIKGSTLSIYTAKGKDSAIVSRTELSREYTEEYGDMFLKDDRIIILQPDYTGDDGSYVSILIYDISNPSKPKEVSVSRQEGWYNSSRMVGDYIYLISDCNINVENIDKGDPSTFVPVTEINGVCEPVPADKIYYYDGCNQQRRYTVVGAFNFKDGAMSDTVSLLGGTDQVYCSKGNIILANTKENNHEDYSDDSAYPTVKTVVSRLSIQKGKIEYIATGEVDGVLDNQFYIDEHNGYFRFVTTVTMAKINKRQFENDEDAVVYVTEEFNGRSARLTILDDKLEKVGEIGDLAQGERVYSVRFMGDIAYFVTFRQTDPLFSADLSDPKNPKILGELKIPGFSEYMYPYGDGLLLGFGMDADENTGRTKDLKLSMFNISDPSNVTEQDITKIDKKTYSPALSNHKAMLVNSSKNLIGFAATGDYQTIKYMVYEYTADGFNKLAELEIDGKYRYAMDDIRGIFVKDEFYIVTLEKMQVYDINTFTQIAVVEN